MDLYHSNQRNLRYAEKFVCAVLDRMPWNEIIAAAYDSAFQEANVKRDKDGKFASQNENGKKEAEVKPPEPMKAIEPNLEAFEKLLKEKKNELKAAHEYFKRFFQNTYLETTLDGQAVKIHFTGKSWQELRKDMYTEPMKAAFIPYIPDVLLHGKHKATKPNHSHPDVETFHTYTKKIKTNKGLKEIYVDVAYRPKNNQEYLAYNLTAEGTGAYKKRKWAEKAYDGQRFEFEVVSIGFSQ